MPPKTSTHWRIGLRATAIAGIALTAVSSYAGEFHARIVYRASNGAMTRWTDLHVNGRNDPELTRTVCEYLVKAALAAKEPDDAKVEIGAPCATHPAKVLIDDSGGSSSYWLIEKDHQAGRDLSFLGKSQTADSESGRPEEKLLALVIRSIEFGAVSASERRGHRSTDWTTCEREKALRGKSTLADVYSSEYSASKNKAAQLCRADAASDECARALALKRELLFKVWLTSRMEDLFCIERKAGAQL